MWLIAAAILYTQIKRVQLLKRHRSYLNLGNYGIREAFVAAALVALTTTHLVWLAFYVWQHQAAYHYLYEGTMSVYWGAALVSQSGFFGANSSRTAKASCDSVCTMQAVVWQGRQHSVSVHLKFLLWPAVIVYIWALYTSTRIYLAHWDVSSRLERIMLLAAGSFQTLLSITAAFTETFK